MTRKWIEFPPHYLPFDETLMDLMDYLCVGQAVIWSGLTFSWHGRHITLSQQYKMCVYPGFPSTSHSLLIRLQSSNTPVATKNAGFRIESQNPNAIQVHETKVRRATNGC